jgi:hypothetical protein
MRRIRERKGVPVTKEELKQIYYLNREIKMWQKELDKLECKSLIKGQVITGMPFGTGISDRTGDTATEIADYKRIIEGKLTEIQIQRKKIIEYIDSIEDSFLRQIIFLRNVSCMNWNQIANELGSNENCMKQIYSRHFRKEKAS